MARGWFTETRQRMKELGIVDEQDMKAVTDALNSVEIATEETLNTVIHLSPDGGTGVMGVPIAVIDAKTTETETGSTDSAVPERN